MYTLYTNPAPSFPNHPTPPLYNSKGSGRHLSHRSVSTTELRRSGQGRLHIYISPFLVTSLFFPSQSHLFQPSAYTPTPIRAFYPRIHLDISAHKQKKEALQQNPQNPLSYEVFKIYSLAVSTVQPDGTPFSPVTSHVAAEFLTNVPPDATPLTQ